MILTSDSRKLKVWFYLGAVLVAGSAEAKELQVGDGNFPTIQAAVNAAQPGDTILVSKDKSIRYEAVTFANRSGTAEAPITLDGQGVVLDGSETLRADEWQETSPGVFRSTAFPARLKMEAAILMRYFFIFDGEANRMGHASKSAAVPYKPAAALEPGEWTYVADEKAFYVRPKAGKGLDSIRVPVLAAAVSFFGNCDWIRVKNVSATRFWNDGFNIHGRTREVRFNNIKAVDCGDDGISAHDDCEIFVDGFVSRGNATGFCHIGNSRTESRNVLIEDCPSYGVFLLDSSKHVLENCVIRQRGGGALCLVSGTELTMNNVLLAGLISPQTGISIQKSTRLTAKNVSAWNLPMTVAGAVVEWSQSLVAGTGNRVSLDAATEWRGEGNLWDVDSLKWSGGVLGRGIGGVFLGEGPTSVAQSATEKAVLQGALAPYGFDAKKLSWYPGKQPYLE